MSEQICLINLNHPCREIDIWLTESQDDVATGRGQGYIPLTELRQIVAQFEAMQGRRRSAQREDATAADSAVSWWPTAILVPLVWCSCDKVGVGTCPTCGGEMCPF
jgi:hypothetical protein